MKHPLRVLIIGFGAAGVAAGACVPDVSVENPGPTAGAGGAAGTASPDRGGTVGASAGEGMGGDAAGGDGAVSAGTSHSEARGGGEAGATEVAAGEGGTRDLSGGMAGAGAMASLGGEGGSTAAGAAGEGSGGCADQGMIESWRDEFDSASLSPAWAVWQYAGERHNNQTSPANHFSLSESAGRLRYYVDPMTHPAAWRDYAAYFASPYYWYDPGLSLERELGGLHWALEIKASYFVPNVVNAAQHEVAVHFDPPGTAGLHCYLDRFSNDDVGAGTSKTNNVFNAACSIGEEGVAERWSEWAGLDTTIVRFVRFERDGASLKIRMGAEQGAWTDLVTMTIPEAFACAQQKLLISGAAWFSPQGSYADYDYVHFSR